MPLYYGKSPSILNIHICYVKWGTRSFSVSGFLFIFKVLKSKVLMISHIVLLNHGNNLRINQQIISGKYLVLNAPWHSSCPDTVVKRQNNVIHIESRSIVCKVSDGKVIFIETVYHMDKALKFTELTPSPPLNDFFLAKAHFLRNISHRRPSTLSDNVAFTCIGRRRPMRFIVPVLLYLFRDVVEYLLVNAPDRVIEHITSQPIGVKQNIAIKMTLGTLAKAFCSLQKTTIRLGHPIVFINRLYLFPTHAYLFVFSFLYSTLIASFIEVVQLLNNSSHNPLKNRRDSIILSTDQIFMSVLIFSFYLLIIMNMVCFHAFSVFMGLCLIALKYVEDFLDFLFVDVSSCSTYRLDFNEERPIEPRLRYRKVSIWEKVMFAMEASFYASDVSKDRFLVRLLFGVQ